jgi:signal transduction histidine kinase/ligand-binding sensor domain-containing protein/DNA-binding response OmpR family regulator
MLKLLLAGLLLFLPLLSSGETQSGFSCRNISVEDGLRSNAVRNVVQDKWGFIWFGTDNGLSRFDGYEVKNYSCALLGSNQYVSSLIAEPDRMLVGTEKGIFTFDYRTEQFAPFLAQHVKIQPNSFAKDRDGNLWIATMGQGVFRYRESTGRCKQFSFKAQKGRIAQVFVDADNQVWTITSWGRPSICKLNKAKDEFVPVPFKSETDDYGGLKMMQGKDGRLWIGTWNNGLLCVEDDGTLTQVLNPKLTGVGYHIHTVMEKSPDCILLGCDDGIVHYNPQSNTWKRMVLGKEGANSLSDKFVYSIFCDNEGGLWIGTYYSGVNYLSPAGNRFISYGNGQNGYRANVVSSFCEDDFGRIWIGSDDGGLACYSEQTKKIVDYPGQDILSTYNVHGLCADGKDLWIGTYSNGVIRLNTTTGSQRVYTEIDGVDGRSSYAIHKDRQGRLWVGTMESICLYDAHTDHFVPLFRTGAMIIDIDEDAMGNIWFSTLGAGLLRYHTATRKWKQYRHGKAAGSLPSDQLNCLYIDSSSRMWVATQDGLCRYNANTDSFEWIELKAPSLEVQGVLEYEDGLWLATTRGIMKYTEGAPLQIYNKYDGLPSEQLQPNAALKSSDGRAYFGSVKGFVAFYPYRIRTNKMAPRVVITGLEIFNKEQQVGSKVLPENLHCIDEINLSYRDNMFSLRFSSLSYISPEKNLYTYKLEGFDREWIDAGRSREATYTNIPAGTYTFRVKASNNDGVWGAEEATLRIVVEPPFWWSLPAKVFYVLLLLYLIYAYTQMRLKKAEHRHQYEMKTLNEKKELEVREARLQFFTMIAHEIRTPVTLIIGPLEQLIQKVAGKGAEELEIIDRNAHRLLDLVNQLLDFDKVEQQGLKVYFKLHNIRKLMESVAVRFRPTLEQRGISFTVNYPPEDFCAVIDEEGVTKIISNLMTNANKYTKDMVLLSCTVDTEHDSFSIIVEDNGMGIGKNEREQIFRPFYQAKDNKPGTGIGLSIVKNLVDLHHGKITVESEEGQGSRFVVELPISALTPALSPEKERNMSVTSESIPTSIPEESGEREMSEDSAEQSVLIVEDDEDMLRFISNHFRKDYRVYTAMNGAEGWEVLCHHGVSLIVSDWMMPEMDGAALCRRVREDRNTSHIPFVMLTAKTDNDSKTEGMECGADAYIEKPFSMKYLEACIRNLIDMRTQLMKRFSNTPSEPISQIASNHADNEFLTRMNEIIEENIANPKLNVTFLAEQMAISRSGLFAKIKSLTNVTPNEMIQVIRLRKAAILLREGRYRINEVSYMVGFGSPSYFTKCFQKQFGVNPGEYVG